MYDLCEQIQKEADHKRFTELVLELNVLLERKGDRLSHRSDDFNDLEKGPPGIVK